MDKKILDLSVYAEQTLDITFPDETILHVKKPTQAIVIAMMNLAQLNQENQASLLEGLVEICAAILDNNKEGKSITPEWVANELDIVMISAIVKGYTQFTEELQSNPI